ncbi:MAG: hypothetical protein JEZ03_13080 [Bacteroidales bacterium]|nr:hypothetical protein [Bacteroidales bacterium]
MKKALLIVILTAGVIFLSYFFSNKREMEFNEKDKQELIDVDRRFSQISIEQGMKKAFLVHLDTNAVLLKPNKNPIVGFSAIQKHFTGIDDEKFTLRWIPKRADVSKLADMGFTFGTYELLNKETQEISEAGTYCSIWKKNKNNEWKLILDTGNEGLD